MKKGNIGMVFGVVGKKLKSSLGGSVDYGLTGKDGVVHPSLAVRILKDPFSAGFRCIRCFPRAQEFSIYRKVQRSLNRMSAMWDRLWKVCCTDTER